MTSSLSPKPVALNSKDSADSPSAATITQALRGLDLIRRIKPGPQETWEIDEKAAPASGMGIGASFESKLFDRYEIIGPLGQGGFGTVVAARDRQLGRMVAIKIPRFEILFSESLQRRFVTETQVLATLEHPGIVPVYDADTTGALWYLVMAYCGGPTLAKWLAEEPKPVDNRVAACIIACVADAVHYAHVRGIIHRDIKPANILLEPNQEAGHGVNFPYIPKLTDFGLSRTASTPGTSPTKENAVLGSQYYMAPEQAAAEHSSVGVETDVYALGAVLYELLSGSPPLSDVQGINWCVAVRDQKPRSLRLVRQDVPAQLAAICDKCLAKSPKDRYASAQALRGELLSFLDDKPVTARMAHCIRRSESWRRQKPGMFGLTMTVAAALVVVASVSFWRGSQAGKHVVVTNPQKQVADGLAFHEAAVRRLLALHAANLDSTELQEDLADEYEELARARSDFGDATGELSALEEALRMRLALAKPASSPPVYVIQAARVSKCVAEATERLRGDTQAVEAWNCCRLLHWRMRLEGIGDADTIRELASIVHSVATCQIKAGQVADGREMLHEAVRCYEDPVWTHESRLRYGPAYRKCLAELQAIEGSPGDRGNQS